MHMIMLMPVYKLMYFHMSHYVHLFYTITLDILFPVISLLVHIFHMLHSLDIHSLLSYFIMLFLLYITLDI